MIALNVFAESYLSTVLYSWNNIFLLLNTNCITWWTMYISFFVRLFILTKLLVIPDTNIWFLILLQNFINVLDKLFWLTNLSTNWFNCWIMWGCKIYLKNMTWQYFVIFCLFRINFLIALENIRCPKRQI